MKTKKNEWQPVVWGKVSTCIGEFLGFRHKLRGYLHQLSCQLSASPSNLIDMPFMDTDLPNIIISFYYVLQWVIDYRIINNEQTQMVRQRMGHRARASVEAYNSTNRWCRTENAIE